MTGPDLLADDDIAARIAERMTAHGGGVVAGEASASPARGQYRYVRPLLDAANGLIEYVTNPEGRYMFGFHDLDLALRGLARREFCIITGMTHSGKSQLLLNAFNNNRTVPSVFFTPDETSELVLSKLVSISRGLSADSVEQAIKDGHQPTIQMVRDVAAQDFANLVVIDDNLSWGQMSDALKEAEAFFGQPVEFCAFDYLELFGGDEPEAVGQSAKRAKAFIHDHNVFGVMIHQSKTRSGAKRGQAAGMEGMRYGGEQEAFYVLEVFRKKDDDALEEWERSSHANTVTVNIAKNKRPPCKRGVYDLFMDANTGLVRDLRTGEGQTTNPLEIHQPTTHEHRLTAYEIMQQQAEQLPGVGGN